MTTQEKKDAVENKLFELIDEEIWRAFEDVQMRYNYIILLPKEASAKVDGLIDQIVAVLTNRKEA